MNGIHDMGGMQGMGPINMRKTLADERQESGSRFSRMASSSSAGKVAGITSRVAIAHCPYPWSAIHRYCA